MDEIDSHEYHSCMISGMSVMIHVMLHVMMHVMIDV